MISRSELFKNQNRCVSNNNFRLQFSSVAPDGRKSPEHAKTVARLQPQLNFGGIYFHHCATQEGFSYIRHTISCQWICVIWPACEKNHLHGKCKVI